VKPVTGARRSYPSGPVAAVAALATAFMSVVPARTRCTAAMLGGLAPRVLVELLDRRAPTGVNVPISMGGGPNVTAVAGVGRSAS